MKYYLKQKRSFLSYYSIFLVVIHTLVITVLHAQTQSISGRVFDAQSKEPLGGANVFLSDRSIGSTTDDDGFFRLRIRNISTTDSLLVRYIGYQNYKIALHLYESNSIIYLLQKIDLEKEIIVTGDRIDLVRQDIPHATNIIKQEQIQELGSAEISDILKPISAVRIEGNDLDGRKIQIRGSNSDEVNVYLDGILINDLSFDNAADLSLIPVENIQQLEVVKGANMALMGNGAFGGILNIVSTIHTKPGISLKAKIGSFDTRYYIGSLDIPLMKQLVLNYFGQFNRFSPGIEYFPDEKYAPKSQNGKIETRKQNHHLSLNYYMNNARLSSKYINYSFNYLKPNWESSYQNNLYAAVYSGSIFGYNNFEFQINQLYSDNEIIRSPEGSSKYISNYFSDRLNLKLTKKMKLKDGFIQFLTEYVHNDLKTHTKVKDINWQNSLYRAYIYDNRFAVAGVLSYKDKLEHSPILSWETFIGIREDFLASGNHDFTNMIGGQIYYTAEQVHIIPYFNIGKNVKYPSLTEQAYTRDLKNPEHQDSTNIQLDPEYSNSTDGGFTLKYFPNTLLYHDLEYSIGAFSRTIFNSIIRRPFDDLIADVQQGRSYTRGVETNLKLNGLLKHFNLGASYIYLDIENPLLYAYKPNKNASLSLNYYSRFGFYLTSTYFYEGKSLAWYYDQDNNIKKETIEPFEDLDLSIGLKRKFFNSIEIDMQLSGYNVFDNSKFKYYYLKKRYVQASFAIRY